MRSSPERVPRDSDPGQNTSDQSSGDESFGTQLGTPILLRMYTAKPVHWLVSGKTFPWENRPNSRLENVNPRPIQARCSQHDLQIVPAHPVNE